MPTLDVSIQPFRQEINVPIKGYNFRKRFGETYPLRLVDGVKGEVAFNIIAKATSRFQMQPDKIPNFDPSAHMVVWLDDVLMGATYVPLGEWTTHSFAMNVTTGVHTLIIEFTNNIHRPAEKKDRNLTIDRVIIQNERYEYEKNRL